MTPLLSVRGLTKSYGAHVGGVDVSFDLCPGEVMGIVGESGSGKSTLLSCLAGNMAPNAGEVVFDTRSGGAGDGAGPEASGSRGRPAHDLAVVRLLADRLMVMKSGRVVEAGLTYQVLDDPQHAYNQLLVSSVLQV